MFAYGGDNDRVRELFERHGAALDQAYADIFRDYYPTLEAASRNLIGPASFGSMTGAELSLPGLYRFDVRIHPSPGRIQTAPYFAVHPDQHRPWSADAIVRPVDQFMLYALQRLPQLVVLHALTVEINHRRRTSAAARYLNECSRNLAYHHYTVDERLAAMVTRRVGIEHPLCDKAQAALAMTGRVPDDVFVEGVIHWDKVVSRYDSVVDDLCQSLPVVEKYRIDQLP